MAGCRIDSRAHGENRKCQGGTVSRHGSQEWGLTATGSCELGAQASRAGMASGGCLVGARANIEVVLEALAAPHSFQAIVSAEHVRKGKPDPGVYLTAASRVGALPARCIVVEDALAGIEGARRAGMRSIGVSHNGEHLPADLVVPSLDRLDAEALETLLRCGIRSV